MWGRLFIVSVVVLASVVQASKIPPNSFRNGMLDYFKYGEFSPEFRNLMKLANMRHVFRSDAQVYDDTLCQLCDEVLDVVLDEIRGGAVSLQELQAVIIELCTFLVFESYDVCSGAISSNIEIVWFIALARPERRSDTICGIVGQSYGCGGRPDDWTIQIPPGSSEINQGVVSGEAPIQVLHLTDIHYDSLYAPGSLATCGLPVCCTVNTVPDSPENAAGFWGDYRDCDTPLHAIDDALDHIVAQHPNIDYIYYTGDIISHRVWDTSVSGNTDDLVLIFDRLDAAFPNTPIYPAFGNHEPHPLNVFAPLEVKEESLSTQWLFDLSAKLWERWLNEDALATVRIGGYYTVLVKPGFRIIVLNSNVAYTMNWWLIYDDFDPYGQLQWLANTLYEAEQNGEKVNILSHLPSSDGTTYIVWSREYRRIVDRFAGIISATFNGHSHRDELVLYHSIDNPSEPINVAWNGGSLTTFSDKNPNYKIFSVDPVSYEVLDFDVWTYNITAANLAPDVTPAWFRLYSFKDAYGLSGAAPKDVRQLAINMATERAVVEQYFRFTVRYADSSLGWGCETDCLRNLLCDLVKSEFSDYTQCLELSPEW